MKKKCFKIKQSNIIIVISVVQIYNGIRLRYCFTNFEIFSTNAVRRKIAVLRFQQDYDLFWVQKFNRQNKYRSQTMRRCHFPPKTPSHFPTQPIFSLSSPFSLSSAVLMAEWILP